MNRRKFLATAAGPALTLGRAQTRRKPNIVFLLADDLGYGDLGCYGQKRIATPNIDRLAAEGMRFRQAYAGCTVCAPSRCALMTGKHSGHGRVRGNAHPEVPLAPGDVTVAEVLRKAGYRTGMFGKWGLGDAGTTGMPNLKGFDEFFGYHTQQMAHTYYPQELWENDHEFTVAGNLGVKTTWSPDLILPRALKFIEQNRERPFFLYVPFTMPHANNELGTATGDGMEIPDRGRYEQEAWPNPEKGFAAMVTRMDSDVGKILAALKSTGLENDTVVFFTSDNGPHHEGGHDAAYFGSSGGLRGVKRDLYEGGIREPSIVKWPGRVKAGTVSDQIWAFWDFLPTAAEIAGGQAPRGIDGVSMVPSFLGDTQKDHEYLYWEFHEGGFSQAIRMGDWKAVRVKSQSAAIELYDLETDVAEKRDVAAQHPEIVARMAKLMVEARTDSKEFPVVNKR
jgi:arylsulfatase A-like enzyme